MGLILVGSFPSRNFPGENYRGWESSLVGVFRVGIVQGRNLPGGNFPSTNKHIIKMSKRKSVIVVHSDSAKVAPQISTTTNVPVRQVNREELKVE